MAAVKKTKKLRYLENLPTNLDEISFVDACWLSGHCRAKTFKLFIARWQTTLILRNRIRCIVARIGDGLQRGVAGAGQHDLASFVHVLLADNHLPAAARPAQSHLRTGRP